MIYKVQVIPMLLEVCPSYQIRWNIYYSDTYIEGEEQLLYLDLADFASHIIELFKDNKCDSFGIIFELIEKIHIQGDEYVKEAITIGFLEDLQNFALGEKIELANFEEYLGIESKKWWDQLNDFWSGKIQYVGETY